MAANIETFIARVRARRAELGLSAEALSMAAGMAPSTLSVIEYRRRFPRFESAVAMADVLGVSLDWLCGRVDAIYPTVMPTPPVNMFTFDEKAFFKAYVNLIKGDDDAEKT